MTVAGVVPLQEIRVKTLKLNILQRMRLVNLLGAQEGRQSDIRIFQRLMDVLELTEEERQLCDFQTQAVESMGIVNYSWTQEKDFETDLLLRPEDYSRLRGVLETWPRFTTLDNKTWLGPVLEKMGL